MQKRIEQFLALTSVLTGFSQLELLGTAMAGEYLDELDAVLPTDLLDTLLAVYEHLPAGADRDAAIASQILNDSRLGPVARNVILMWYTGSWTALPAEWRAIYGASHLDRNRVVSAEAYQAGLQWVTAGAHPAGARQQGFGAWSSAPERSVP